MPQRRRCVLLIAIIVIHRHVNYTGGYKRQYDRLCRPGPRWASPGSRFCWLLRRPVKVKSLVCLNQCARKRPSYLCPIITETSSTSQTSNPIPAIPCPSSIRPLPMVSSPFRCATFIVLKGCDLAKSCVTYRLRWMHIQIHLSNYECEANKAANDRVGVTFNLFTTLRKDR